MADLPVRLSFSLITPQDFLRKIKRLKGPGVIAVWLAVSLCFSILLYHTTHFPPVLLKTRRAEELLIWGVFTLIFSVFFGAIWKDPGTVSKRYEPTLLESRYLPPCTLCTHYKAPRASHCWHCGYCIQRRDHHCPWINNCVGFNNERIFFFFLTVVVTTSHLTTYWVILHLLHHTCLSSLPPLRLSSLPSSLPVLAENIIESCPIEELDGRQGLLLLTLILDIGILLSVTWLVMYQMQLVATNMTTIEDLLTRALDKAVDKKGGDRFSFVYDVGLGMNMKRLFGRSWNDFVYSLLFPLLDERLDYSRGTKWPTKEGSCRFQTEIFRKYYDMSLAHPKFLREEVEKFNSLTEKKNL